MNVDQYAKIAEAAFKLIEANAIAYQTFNKAQANSHTFRCEEALKKIADALGFDLVRRETVAAPVKQAAE